MLSRRRKLKRAPLLVMAAGVASGWCVGTGALAAGGEARGLAIMDALTPWHQDIADLVLAGHADADIAAQVGRPLDYVRGIVRSPLFRLILADAEHDRLGSAARRARMQLAEALPDAISAFKDGLLAERVGYRLKAAGRIMDGFRQFAAKAMDDSELSDAELAERVTEARAWQRARVIPALGVPVEPLRVRTVEEAVAVYADDP